jgi:hypothetical protein
MVRGSAVVRPRKYERVPAEWPVSYKIGKNAVTGSTVNVCKEGMMVRSYLYSKKAIKVFKALNKEPGCRLEVEYTCEGNTYCRDARIMHFHFDFSGGNPYQATIGFWIPKIE